MNEEKSLEERLFELVFSQPMNLRFDIERYQKKLNHISSRITAKDSKFLINLPTNVLYCILNNEHFNYDNEDFIFDIINEHFLKQNQNPNRNRNYHSNSNYYINNYHQCIMYEFYEKIQICELSLKKFESMISNLNYSEISQGIWAQLVELILTHKTKNPKPWKTKANGKTIEYDDNPDHRFNGIIHHLQSNCNTNNLHDFGIINVTSKSAKGNHFPKNAIEFDSYNYFFSLSGFDWLKSDFKDRKIRPISYSVKKRFDSNKQNQVNWCIEVSNTGGDNDEEWRVIDSRSGFLCVSKQNQADTFRIQLQLTNEESYRYLRLKSAGKTSGKCSCLAISSLEYFGTLFE